VKNKIWGFDTPSEMAVVTFDFLEEDFFILWQV